MNKKKNPKLALVGRPNVGKSALFNRICKKRISIVDEAEGITRDRLYADTDLFGRPFEVIDTGGIDPRSKADFNTEIKRQAEIAIEEADSIVLVVDAVVGITDLDLEVAKILHRTKKPLTVAVNKVDSHAQQPLLHEFHGLGIPNMIPVSAAQNWQIAELLEVALKNVVSEIDTTAAPGSVSVALIGRPNVGKSSLINKLIEEERCVVSPIPGTTRDAIEVSFEQDGEKYTFIDTAGIRRKHAEHEVVDKFAAIRTKEAIERADVCLLMVDVVEGLTTQEKRIATQIEKEGKGCILLLNKWDLKDHTRMEHVLKEIEDQVAFLRHCPKIICSAKTGRNLDKIFEELQKVYEATRLRIPTPQLNQFIEKAMQITHPPMIGGKRLRVYYMTQVRTAPPHFLLFINYPELMSGTYKRYLINQFRKEYPFPGAPLIFQLKGKEKKKKPSK